MLKKTRYASLFLFMLLFATIAYAEPFDVNAVPIKDAIGIEEDAKYRLEIKNNLDIRQEFRIYTLDYPFWDIRTEPIVNPILLEVRPQSNASIEIFLDPLHVTQAGAYIVNVNVKAESTGQMLSVPIEVGIKSIEPLIGGYVPTVITSVSIPEKIDPREEIPIKINLNNQNPINYDDLIIKIESDVINDAISYKLGPREEKVLALAKKADPFTKPQKDKLSVTVFKGERLIVNPIVKQVEILEYGSLEQTATKKGFLRTKKEFLFSSNNENYIGQAKAETTFFKALFTSTSPRAKTVVEGGKRYLAWDIELQGANTLKITVTENLLPLLVIIILIIVLVVLYYLFRSPLVMMKEAKNIHKRDGGISEMRVVLHIRNRGSVPVKNIDITERVAHLMHVERDVSIGTMHPEKILRHENRDTIVKWIVESVEPHEERVLTYTIKSTLPILGGLTLPAAGAKFHYNEKVFVASSNRLNVEA